MIEYLNRYIELTNKLDREKRTLTELYSMVNQIQKEYQENQNNIEYLNNDIKELEDSITLIINNKLDKVKQRTIIFSIMLFITVLGTISTASNFNFNIIFSTSIYSIIGCYFFNINIYSLLEKSYRKNNKKIIAMKELINDKKIELNQCKEERENLIEERRIAVINSSNQERKVEQIENLINSIKIDYATPIFNRELNITEKDLVRIKKI